jgi:tetratricopeptide (TPR) repeat protein
VESDLGRYTEARLHNDERLRLARLRNNLKEEASSWNIQGINVQSLGELISAGECFEKSVSISRTIGYRRGEVIALHNLAGTYADQGRWEMAARCEEQYLAISRSTGNRLAEAYAPFTLLSIALEQGEYEKAEAFLQQGMQAAEQNGWLRLIDVGRQSLASLQFYRWCEHGGQALLQEVVTTLRELAQNPRFD